MRAVLISAALVALPVAAVCGPLPASGVADYQLGGGYPPPPGVTMVARDSTDRPAPGYFNICYVNGFQTQPGVNWPDQLLVPGPDARPLADPGWPDEYLLDISTDKMRRANLALVLPAIETCAAKGFDAVEFDNLDSYSRSEGYLSLEDSLAFAQMLVAAAAGLGLPSGQKNSAELASRGRDLAGFSFAVTEECDRWQECAAFTDVYGQDQVIDIEYADDLRAGFEAACAAEGRPRSMILRDRLLVPAGASRHVFQACP